MSVTPSPWLKSAKEMWSRESSFYVFISRGGFVHLMAPPLNEDGLKRAGEVPTSCGTVWLARVRNGERSLMSCSARGRRLPRLIFKTFCIGGAV